MFAKPAHPGTVKTRLAASIGSRAAAALARAFVEDTWALLESVEWAQPLLATTDLEWGASIAGPELVAAQGEGDLGVRVERVLARALERRELALAIGSDSPGLPRELLDQALAALDGHDAVLGPCEDGGFYLLGLGRCPPGLLRGLPWSEPVTFQRTLARLRARGLSTAILPPWFDVDTKRDLEQLRRLLLERGLDAPRTSTCLRDHFREPATKPT